MSKSVTILILGKEFSVACPEDEQEDLLAAARYLDGNMKQIQKSGKIIGAERTAIMAALNITNDLLKLQSGTKGQLETQSRLAALQAKVSDALKEAENNPGGYTSA